MERIAIAVLLYASSSVAFADTLVVDNDFVDCPQAQFNSIQAAVFAAQPGDKILVCPGVYAESVLINNNSDLRIEAQAAPGEVVLQGPHAQQFGFHLLNTTGVLVQGFTVKGFGTVFDPNPQTQGANIRIEGGSGNTLRKNVTRDSPQGDGIQVLNSSANVVEQNTSFDNRGTLSDGITVTGAAAFDNIVRHNETFQNRQSGINIIGPTGLGPTGRDPTGNVVFGNRSHGNLVGIRNVALVQGTQSLGAHGNVIENNHVFTNVRGIIVAASTNVIVRNNRSEGNIEFGIRLQNGAANNLVEKNEVFQNTEDGILLRRVVIQGVLGPPVVNNMIQLNHVRENGRDGIRIFDALSAGNTIELNVLLHNIEHDAHDDSFPGTNFWINNRCGAEDHPGQNENRPGLCENH